MGRDVRAARRLGMHDDPVLAVGSRRTATVLLTDVVGFTSIGERHDPELARAVLTRDLAATTAAIERHGGTVEEYVGRSVMGR